MDRLWALVILVKISDLADCVVIIDPVSLNLKVSLEVNILFLDNPHPFWVGGESMRHRGLSDFAHPVLDWYSGVLRGDSRSLG
jgi:hypothetical protein